MKMVEPGRIPAQGLFASFHPLKFLSGNVQNNVESETIRPLLIFSM